MQDPNADTEWNDILRAKGILPPKQEVKEEEIDLPTKQEVEQNRLNSMTNDQLSEALDDEDESYDAIMALRRKRLEEMRDLAMKKKFGDVREITAVDYVQEVNKAGEGIWVVLHLYKTGIPLCAMINEYLSVLSKRFPHTKFLKAISTTCIPNFPDANLPAIFVYCGDDLKKQIIGALSYGGTNLTQDALEWMLYECGAVKTKLESDPRKSGKVRGTKINGIDGIFSNRKRDEDDSETDSD